MQPTYIPTHVDDPQHLLLWSADEVVPIVLGLVFGMIIQKALRKLFKIPIFERWGKQFCLN